MPWVYIRHVLAQRWGVRPWDVDAAPWDEVVTALELFRMENEAALKHR